MTLRITGRQVGLGLLAAAVFLSLLWFARAPLLSSLAEWWIMEAPLEKSDAILVLGGGEQTRPARAAELYHQGFAPVILVIRPQERLTDELKITPPDHEVSRQVLLAKGVPETAIEFVGSDASSTLDEAKIVSQWNTGSTTKQIIIPTDQFHTRRVNWVFRKHLKKSKTITLVTPVESVYFHKGNWWHSEHGLHQFFNEVLKMGYYVLRY